MQYQIHTVDSIKTKAAKVILPLFIALAALAIVVYMKFYYTAGNGIECFTHKYFGIYCMGCGSTRQLYYALDGQLAKAFSYNVACVIIYPIYAYMYYLILKWSIKNEKVSYKQAYVLAGAAALLVIYMILRNIPIEAFDFLRPPE